MTHRDGLDERLGRLDAPTLVIFGTKDDHFPDPRAEAEKIAGQVSGTVLMVEGAGHYCSQRTRAQVVSDPVPRWGFVSRQKGQIRPWIAPYRDCQGRCAHTHPHRAEAAPGRFMHEPRSTVVVVMPSMHHMQPCRLILALESVRDRHQPYSWDMLAAQHDARASVVPLGVLARALVVHVAFATSMPVMWVFVLEYSQAWLVIALLCLRVLTDGAALAWSLGPALRWQRDSDEELLREADDACQRVTVRFIVVASLSWSVAIVSLLGLATMGVGAVGPLGDLEWAIGLLILVAGLFGIPGLTEPAVRWALLGLQRDISLELLQRNVDIERPPRKFMKSAINATPLLSFAALLGAGAIACMFYLESARELALSEGRRAAEVSAARPDAPVAGVEIVGFEDLPPALTMDTTTSSASRIAFDARYEHVLAAAPLEDGRWAVSIAPYEEHSWLYAGLALLMSLFALTPVLAVGVPVRRMLTAPLNELEDAVQEFVRSGELDPHGRVVPLHNDELGRLGSSFNRMLGLLSEFAAAATLVSEGDLRVQLEQPGSLHQAFRGMLDQLNDIVTRIREASLELSSAANEIHAATQEQEAATNKQSASIRAVSDTVTSLAGSAASITAVAQTALTNTEQTVATTTDAAAEIDALNEGMHGVAELLGSISEIADRSDLLALNGSLEAVRAGEAGRGFALVASEMRRLAERVTGLVGDVRVQLQRIEDTAASTVRATDNSRVLAEGASAAAREISEVTEQQGQDTRQAAQRVQEVAQSVTASAASISQTRATAQGLRQQAEALEKLTERFVLQDRARTDAQ